jgi:formate hydrogenlyase subunit 3/multisubunit Na+/H+ antiporter MnhD subunit
VLGTLPALPAGWAVALGLIGGLGALACGAGALGVRRLRPLLGWAAGAQASLVIVAAGLADPLLAPIAGPTLLIAMMLGAVLAASAAVSFERITGSDDYTQATAAAPPRVAGIAWAAAAVAILGLPPLFGLWGRLFLLQMALEQQPWVTAPLLAGAALLALALLAPLAGFWATDGRAARARAGWSDWLPALLALAPLLALGAEPYLAWRREWLPNPDELITDMTPVPGLAARAIAMAAGVVLVLVAVLVSRAPSARTIARDPDEEAVRLPPEAAGEALRPLAWLALPAPLLGALWAGLERTSEGLRFLMGLFEQRYYLLGVLAALITIMLLMAQ